MFARLARHALALVLLPVLVASPAWAVGVTFPDFSDTSALTLNGSATPTTTADGAVLRLTAAAGSQSGSAFGTVAINAATFSTFFVFRITDPGGATFDCNTTTGADGLVFVVQNVSASIGGSGQGIGYAGIGNSIGVEWDTWCNAANNDPDSNHIGIDLDGSVDHGTGAPFTLGVTPDFDDGNLWYAWVDYDGTTLEVRTNQTGVRPAQPDLTRDLDLPTILGSTTAFVGFTSGTGSAWGNHYVLSWEYRDEFNPVETTTTTSTSTSVTSTSAVPTTSTAGTSTTTTSTTSSTTSTAAPATTTSTSSTTSTTLVAAKLLEGRKLLVTQKKSGLQRLQVFSKDPQVMAADPCETAGELRIVAEGGGGYARSIVLEATGWKPISHKHPERGCKYRKGDVAATVILKTGKMLKVITDFTDLGFPLDADPRPVRIEVRHGDIRHCLRFDPSDKGKFKAGKMLLSKNRAPADACPDAVAMSSVE
jgi:hypothetical protein